MNIPAVPTSSGQSLTGRVSWFGGPNDGSTSQTTASGAPTSTPGIAIYNRATLGGYWRVTDTKTGRSAVLKQTDLGPAPWTGRKIDVTYSALNRFGYGEHNFPTDSTFKAEYLGRTPQAATMSTPPTPSATLKVPGIPGLQFNQKAFQQAQRTALVGKLMASSDGGSTANNPLFAAGLLTTKAPSPDEYMTQRSTPEGRSAPRASVGPKAPVGLTVMKGGYVHPLPSGFTEGRTDQGVDFSATPGAPIRAIGNGRVLGIEPNWYKGQPFVYYELTSGPAKGHVVYVAEQITPAVRAGQQVRAGEVIGHYAPSGTGIEMGWATKSGQTLAMATGGYSEGEQTQAGKDFHTFLQQLKVK